MNYIKKYGRTVVVTNKGTKDLSRKIQLNAKANEEEGKNEAKELESFLMNDPTFLLSIWCSTIDKCLPKKSKNEFILPELFEARERLKNSVLNLWKSDKEIKEIAELDSLAFTEKFNNLVHNYKNILKTRQTRGKALSKTEKKDLPILNDLENKASKLYKTLKNLDNKPKHLAQKLMKDHISERDIVLEDFDQEFCNILASKMLKYLYGKDESGEFNDTGVIQKQSKAIRNSRINFKVDETTKIQRETKNPLSALNVHFSDTTRADYKLQDLVESLNQVTNIDFKLAMIVFSSHAKKVFTNENKEALIPSERRKHPLWPYHEAIKAALKIELKRQKKNKRTIEPKTNNNGKQGSTSHNKNKSDKKHTNNPSAFAEALSGALSEAPPVSTAKQPKQQKRFSSVSLHNMVNNRQKNKDINNAIRLGKVLHYSYLDSKDKNDGSTSILDYIIKQPMTDILASDYWQSSGQTKIKQQESFVRIWLTAIAHGASSIDNLLYTPDNDENKESIYHEIKLNFVNTALDEHAKNNELQIQLINKFNTLFGKGQALIPEFNEIHTDLSTDSVQTLRAIAQTLDTLRNASFHFKSLEDFTKALATVNTGDQTNKKIRKRITNNVNTFVSSALTRQKQILSDELVAIKIENYVTEEQLKTIINESQKSPRGDLLLTKFSKLLEQHNIVDSLISSPSQKVLDNSPFKRCQYHVLKNLYRHGFSHWLVTQETRALNNLLNRVKNKKTAIAKYMNKADTNWGLEIKARLEILPLINQGTSVQEYFSTLNAYLASDLHVQQRTDTFKSSASAAQKVASIVNTLKDNFLLIAFKEYLKVNKLTSLLNEEMNCINNPVNPELIKTLTLGTNNNVQGTDNLQPWIYIVLHLVPLEIVNGLALSLRKNMALNPSAYKNEEFIGHSIYKTLSLYLDIRNANTEIDSLTSEGSYFHTFFEHKNDFENLFSTDYSLLPVKGLKEVLRYGSQNQMQKLFANNKISKYEIETLKDKSKDISETYKTHQSDHDIITGANRKIKISYKQKLAKCDSYIKNTQTITEYRFLKNRVHLHHPKMAHQLIMTILGRYVAYSQQFERDMYYHFLYSVFSSETITEKDFPADNKEIGSQLSKGQIISALDKIQETSKKGEEKNNLQKIAENTLDYFKVNSQSNSTNRDIRNNLAHFNPLRHPELINLTSLLNQVRHLVSYDRKLKNSVAKSTIDILSRHNLNIKFKINKNHELEKVSLQTKTIDHIKNISGKTFTEDLVSKKYTQVVEKLW